MSGQAGSSFRSASPEASEGAVLSLRYAAPYDFDALLSFFRYRALEGVEAVDERSYARTVSLRAPSGESCQGWVRVSDDAARCRLDVSLSASLLPVADEVSARIRRMFDLDCDPAAVSRALAPLASGGAPVRIEGVRVPGCFDSFETACRAVLGQQVSVKAANRLAARIVEAYGGRVETGRTGLSRAWPAADAVCSLDSIEDAFGVLGVIKTRSRVIRDLARLVRDGDAAFDPAVPAQERMARLLAIKGIGPWSANYIAMRTMGFADAFLETDAGVAHALPDLTPKERLAMAEKARPYRSYAVICLWNSLG